MAGFFGKLKAALKKTGQVLNTPVSELLIRRKIDEALLDELEEALIAADVGPRLALDISEQIRQKYRNKEIEHAEEILDFLKNMLAEGLAAETEMSLGRNPDGPTVILLIGVNGTGKTTTTAKLARFLTDQGHGVLLAAADTFRAAAGEQLDIWASRVGVDIVRHKDGADPAAVVFDACDAALARKLDYVLVDTAGRIHTKSNLMQQLEKIHRVAGKKIAGAPHEVLLVLDATTGQNALSQAKLFTEGVGVTGLVLTKLDGTAKGGIVIAINREIRLPIKFVGLGEKETDFAPFDPHEFTDALFAGIATTEKEG
jgi:fused signal recognition particle receptor